MRDGDILMVDKSIEPKINSVVIATVNGEMTVKRLTEVNGNLALTADNPKYPTVLLGNCFWRKGFEAAFGPDRMGEKGGCGGKRG